MSYWLLWFEDSDLLREVFTDETAARARYAQAVVNWNCHLFAEVSATDMEIRGLRRRVHIIEGHNQHFERCESAWCHPEGWKGPGDSPAIETGRPDVWPNGDQS